METFLSGKLQHRHSVANQAGVLKVNTNNTDSCYDIAGPLCFQGDFFARGVDLPKVDVGDILIIHDTGAYTFSLYSREQDYRTFLLANLLVGKMTNDYFFTKQFIQSEYGVQRHVNKFYILLTNVNIKSWLWECSFFLLGGGRRKSLWLTIT